MSKRSIKIQLTIVTAVLVSLGAFGLNALAQQPAFTTFQGGTGTTSPSGILYGDSTIRLKSLGIGSGLNFSGGVLSLTGTSFGYPFLNNSTSTILAFNNGLISHGSTTLTGTVNLPAGSITNTNLQNSSITINTSGLLTGGGLVSLGGTLNLACPTCGTGSTFPFTPKSWGVSTSTTVGFTNGIIANGSSTLGDFNASNGFVSGDLEIGSGFISGTGEVDDLFVDNEITFDGITGSAWSDFCESITGGAGLCDGDDATGAGGSAFPFLTGTNFGTPVVSTTTPVDFKNGLFASSTSVLATTTITNLNGVIVVDGKTYPQNGAGIQKAITDNCNRGGGKIFIPAGTYSVATRITLTCDNTQIDGVKDKTILQATAAIGNSFPGGWFGMFMIDGRTTQVASTTISNVVFDSNMQTATPAVTVAGARNLTLDNILVRNGDDQSIGMINFLSGQQSNAAITSTLISDVTITNSEFASSSAAAVDFRGQLIDHVVMDNIYVHHNSRSGIQLNALSEYATSTFTDFTVTNSKFRYNMLATTRPSQNYGHIFDINREGIIGLKVSHNYFGGGKPGTVTGVGIGFYGASKDIHIDHNHFEYLEESVAPGHQFSDIHASYMWLEDNFFEYTNGIDFDACDYCYVRGNTFKNTFRQSIGLYGPHKGNIIEGNTFIDGSTGTTSLPITSDHEHAAISNGYQGVTIRNNKFIDTGAGTMLYGVYEVGGAGGNGPNVYTDNEFIGISKPYFFQSAYKHDIFGVDPGGNFQFGTPEDFASTTLRSTTTLSVYGEQAVFGKNTASTTFTIKAPLSMSAFILSVLNGQGTHLFDIDSGGQVGIGTSSPQSKLAVSGGATIGADYNVVAPTNGLSVQGNVRIGTTTTSGNPLIVDGTAQAGNFTVIGTAGTNAFDFQPGGAGMHTDSGGTLYLGGAANIYFRTNGRTSGTLQSWIDTSGNLNMAGLGIFSGTGTSTFAGGINLSGGCFSINNTCISGSGGSGTVGAGIGGQFPYYKDNGTTLTATSSLYIDTAGRVGIGDDTPGTGRLVLNGTVGANNVVIDDNDLHTWETTGNGGWRFRSGWDQGDNSGFRFFSGGGAGVAERFTIEGGGDVGIGTSSPSSKLSIEGVANFLTGTSTLYGDLNLHNANATGTVSATNFRATSLSNCNLDTDAAGNFVCGTDASGAASVTLDPFSHVTLNGASTLYSATGTPLLLNAGLVAASSTIGQMTTGFINATSSTATSTFAGDLTVRNKYITNYDTATVCSLGCDYSNIQSAITAVSASSTIYIKNGNYNLGATGLAIPAGKSLTIKGESRDGVHINYTGSSAAFDIGDASADTRYMHMENISVHVGATALRGFSFNRVKNSHFENLNCEGAEGGDCFRLDGTGAYTGDNYFHTIQCRKSADCLTFTTVSNSNHFYGVGLRASANAIDINSGNGNTINGGLVSGTIGINIRGDENYVDAIYCEANTTCVNFESNAQDNDVTVIDVETNTTLVTDSGTENNFSATGDNGFTNFNSGNFGIGSSTPGSLFSLGSIGNFKVGTSTLFQNLLLANLNATGTVQATNFRGSSLSSCDTIDTDAAGNFKCGSDASGAGSSFAYPFPSNATTTALTFSGGVTITCTDCITDTNVSDTLTASNLVAGGSVVSNAEVDDDITLTNVTQITNRDITSLTTSAASSTILTSTGSGLVMTNAPSFGHIRTTLATSTLAGILSTAGISSSGGLNITAGSLMISSGATSTSNNGIDLTSGCFSLAGTCLPDTTDRSFSFASSTLAYTGKFGAAGTTTILLSNASKATTLVSYYCKTDVGTAYITFGDGTASTTYVQCTTSGAAVTPTSNNTWTPREDFKIQLGTSASSPNTITVTATIK